MNPGQYHRGPQVNTRPMSFQYTSSSNQSFQEGSRILSADGLPRTFHGQEYIRNLSQTSNIPSSSCGLLSPLSTLQQAPADWAASASTSPNFEDQSGNYYDYSSVPGLEHEDAFLQNPNFADVPRTLQLPYDPRTLNSNSMTSETYDSSLYMIDLNKHAHTLSVNGSDLLYSGQDRSRDGQRLSINWSPKMENNSCVDHKLVDRQYTLRAASSEASDDDVNISRGSTSIDPEDHGVDEPYAKLIYRALMSVPTKSMALQQIYSWFRENTVKGSSDTKGWMNSIRHNLSMNAAFKKTERKISGDETKKSTEWVLEAFAIKDGVQSTTRYRKGASSKKSNKPEIPTPSRQNSGRKGGISAGKKKLLRHKVKDERSQRGQSNPRLDSGNRTHLQYQSTARGPHRQISPATPNQESTVPSGQYFLPKNGHFEVPYENMCGLEDVQGVYLDDGPLFTNNYDSLFNSSNPVYARHPY